VFRQFNRQVAEVEWRKVTGVEAEVPGPGIGQDFAWEVKSVREIVPHRILVITAERLCDHEQGLILRIETVDYRLGLNRELGGNRRAQRCVIGCKEQSA
jgi:hypothetical protein